MSGLKYINHGTEEYDGEDATIEVNGEEVLINSAEGIAEVERVLAKERHEADRIYHENRRARMKGRTELEYGIETLKDLVRTGRVNEFAKGCIDHHKMTGNWKKYGGEEAEADFAAAQEQDANPEAHNPDDYLHLKY